MILTHHGINSLRNKSNIIYELNVNTFNLETLKDGNAQWSFGVRSPALSIIDDYLSVIFSSGSKQYLTLNSVIGNFNLSQLDEFYLECIYTGKFKYNTFFGPWTYSFCCSNENTYYQFWKVFNKSWSSVSNGGSFSTSDTYKYHFVKDENHFNVKIFKNENIISSGKCGNFGNAFLTHNVDYYGGSLNVTINIHKLKIYLP